MNTESLKKSLAEAAGLITKTAKGKPRLAFVLGSGWDAFSEEIEILNSWNYSDIPHFIPPTVDGHKGKLVLGKINDTLVYCLQGRVHFYEGHTHDQVTFPVRLMKTLGVERVFLTLVASMFICAQGIL
jgi:purine-nucleoside phosphorylase